MQQQKLDSIYIVFFSVACLHGLGGVENTATMPPCIFQIPYIKLLGIDRPMYHLILANFSAILAQILPISQPTRTMSTLKLV